MSKPLVKWTPMQSAAIDTRDKTLLISAAAGSGKTAVLTERIIKRLCDKNDPADISRMLIVTFTKAAAAELKTRISRSISSAIASDSFNRHLSRQLLLLGSAKICTIHSFCLDVIKSNLKLLGLPEGISVGSEPEIKLMAKEVMTDIINDAYRGVFVQGHEAQNFLSLSDMFSLGGSDEPMIESFLAIYDKLNSYPEGTVFLRTCADEMFSEADMPFFETKHGKIVIERAADHLKYLLVKYNDISEKIKDDKVAYEKYIVPLSDEISFLESVTSVISQGKFDLVKEYLTAFAFITLPRLPKGYECEYKAAYQDLRKELKAFIGDELKPLIEADQSVISENSRQSAALILDLYHILSGFDIKFKEEKKRISRMDFSDIERYAFELLVKDGEPTDLAHEISHSFDEIYIDEYQDTNSIQDMIFSVISRKDNRFMVGDIKQSIYGFRGAAPENFSRYRDSFEMYDPDVESRSTASTIFLSNNFRCDSTVVDFCNTVFKTLFKNTSGRVPYYDSDDLLCSKADGHDSTVPVNVVLAGVDDNEDGFVGESEYVAKEIKRLISTEKKKDGTPVTASDIAVLVRYNSTSIPIENALNKLGIMTTNNVPTEFFENSEILLVMSLLNTIDNPMRDIYLAGVLKSPLFSFTLDELVQIRASKPQGTLYEALIAYTEATGFEKGKFFLARLDYFRTLASGTQVDRLIRKLYSECSLFSLVCVNTTIGTSPEEARENLMLLYKYARDFESSSFKGLSSFIKYVDDIIAEKTKLPGASSKAPSSDNVRIMTMHHSKGLEFPVVFVVGAQKKVNTKDIAEPVLIDRHTGVSIDLPGILPGTRMKTLHKTALESAIKENSFEEEMRVLYVAYTRARERLYVTGQFRKPADEYTKAAETAENICPHVIMKPHSYMQWTLISLIANDYISPERCTLTIPESSFECDSEADEKPTVEHDTELAKKMLERIKANLDFKYPHSDSVNIPAKLSVSDLHGDVLDTDRSLFPVTEDAKAVLAGINETTPRFISEKDTDITAADRGTATHEFMQFCDFGSAEANGIEYEIDRMVKMSFITEESAKLIDKKQASDFFVSSLYLEKIKKASSILREHRFNVKLPASLFTRDSHRKAALADESLFVQGIIDCFIENDDGTYTLIDYKTDHIPREYRDNESEFEHVLAKRHYSQLSYYKKALEIITKKKVSEVLIYSFALGRSIDITKFCE
ncbi:MAG: UvrD-helicase domain-containing protein [Clostridia bacterium]|nr:UvrD-helicase domain-containing protein [Clostridia bacterium]